MCLLETQESNSNSKASEGTIELSAVKDELSAEIRSSSDVLEQEEEKTVTLEAEVAQQAETNEHFQQKLEATNSYIEELAKRFTSEVRRLEAEAELLKEANAKQSENYEEVAAQLADLQARMDARKQNKRKIKFVAIPISRGFHVQTQTQGR